MRALETTLLLLMAVTASLAVVRLPRSYDEHTTLQVAGEAVEAVLFRVTGADCSVMLLTDGFTSATAVFSVMKQLVAPWGVGVFEVAVDGQDANMTQAQLSRVVDEARRLRQVSWCVTVVVVSDDPAFLAAFAEWSLKGRLLVWSTRLLVVTRLPLPELQLLHKMMSSRNAMLLIVDATSEIIRGSVYVHLPYSPLDAKASMVASWTPHRGLALTPYLQLFPEKFSRFAQAPNLVVSVIPMAIHNAFLIEEPTSAEGKRLVHTGPIANVVEYLAEGLNFTYTNVMPSDRTFGTKADDGSWTGMLGMVNREEADISIGPISHTATRNEAVDFAWPLWFDSSVILAALGRPEVNPWGFLLPLAPLVWVAILTALLILPVVVFLCSSCLSINASIGRTLGSNTYDAIRILLQQDVSCPADWYWKRMMVAVWMLMTLVLTRSYAGNLMALLAVRHIPQPYQSFRDVLDDPSPIMIWQRSSINAEYLRIVKSGILYEVANLKYEDRLMYRTQAEYPRLVDTLVREGHHILFGVGVLMRNLMAKDYTRTGRCDFYTSREKYLPFSASVVSQKDNPIIPAMQKRYCNVFYPVIKV
ncbi:probable glutamate receptor [Homarus americanus]|uniref:probable glutamate receptor n=1 Tax=Homarus americanus TaxID=6706 RepID=UPI001C444EDA|nr:probable glutamate receptor [Homarus americanus]